MKSKHKSSLNMRRTEANLGQKEAKLEKTQAELKQVSEEQLSHKAGGKAAKDAVKQKTKIERD